MDCPNCGEMVYDVYTTERRIHLFYRQNTTVGWAKGQLQIVIDMLQDRQNGVLQDTLSPTWLLDELNRINNGVKTIATMEEEIKRK